MYYKRDELKHLQYYYDLSSMFDPKSIDVDFGKTSVKIDGKVRVLESVDHGKYTVEGRVETITQWELLKNRCGEGVTLDTDLRRFIIHLVGKYISMTGWLHRLSAA